MGDLRADDDYYGTFAGRWISRALKAARMTQTELAEKSGISRSHLSRIINGRIDPSCALVLKLVEACGCEVKYLTVKLPKIVASQETGPLQSASERLQ